jgi:hypothetical protein
VRIVIEAVGNTVGKRGSIARLGWYSIFSLHHKPMKL